MCYITAATPVTCTRKRRRAVIVDVLESPRSRHDINPDTIDIHADAIDSSVEDMKQHNTVESSEREARLLSGLLYWITTTTTSTTTSYTATITIGSVFCTTAGATLCG